MLEKRINDVIRTVPDFPEKGIMFKDITPIFLYPALCNDIADELANSALKIGTINAVAGVESRGFLFGILLAQKLKVPFHLIRKKGKLPGETIQHTYRLEYGTATIELHKGFIKKDDCFLIHDDVLATGGTAAAAAELVKKEGGVVAGFSFLIELSFLEGRKNLEHQQADVFSIVRYS